MKRIISIVLVFCLALSPINVFAESASQQTNVEYLDDGSYFETVIEDDLSDFNAVTTTASTTTITKSKTTYYKNASGSTMWYVKVTGTFKYDGKTSSCTKATVTAESKNSSWKVSNKSSKAYDNKAKATATGKHYKNNTLLDTVTKSVILTCSPTGKFS